MESPPYSHELTFLHLPTNLLSLIHARTYTPPPTPPLPPPPPFSPAAPVSAHLRPVPPLAVPPFPNAVQHSPFLQYQRQDEPSRSIGRFAHLVGRGRFAAVVQRLVQGVLEVAPAQHPFTLSLAERWTAEQTRTATRP